ncbi:hypothetical protein B0O80DRAFT_520792 [Mortierella sp. GBAus27b]|nr:hypothetical protein B0O80DRAFT_520792 [Mortierella sp. GBAus27b]
MQHHGRRSKIQEQDKMTESLSPLHSLLAPSLSSPPPPTVSMKGATILATTCGATGEQYQSVPDPGSVWITLPIPQQQGVQQLLLVPSKQSLPASARLQRTSIESISTTVRVSTRLNLFLGGGGVKGAIELLPPPLFPKTCHHGPQGYFLHRHREHAFHTNSRKAIEASLTGFISNKISEQANALRRVRCTDSNHVVSWPLLLALHKKLSPSIDLKRNSKGWAPDCIMDTQQMYTALVLNAMPQCLNASMLQCFNASGLQPSP